MRGDTKTNFLNAISIKAGLREKGRGLQGGPKHTEVFGPTLK